jgi:hypothetical protein
MRKILTIAAVTLLSLLENTEAGCANCYPDQYCFEQAPSPFCTWKNCGPNGECDKGHKCNEVNQCARNRVCT